MVCGANKDDYHLLNVTPDVDFGADYADIREVQSGDPCPSCRAPLTIARAIEIGHIFKLGQKYSTSMGATVLSHDGKELPIVMGSYGIGIERILAAAAELYYDELGLVWPRSIAPFQVIITMLRPDDPEQRLVAEQYYDALLSHGIDCLMDDRDERPGVKFKDAELVGIPIRITLGNKFKEGQVEVFRRRQKESSLVSVDSAVTQVRESLDDYPL
jgi:prolyl-tRNA synthetase